MATLVQTIWLYCVYRAMEIGISSDASKGKDLEFWFRANATVISILPTCLWQLKNAIIFPNSDLASAVIRTAPIVVLSALSVFLCLSDAFIIQRESLIFDRGFSYYIFVALNTGMYFVFVFQIMRGFHNCIGIRRVEMQFLALNAGGAALLLGILNTLGNLLNYRPLNRGGIFLLILASALTAWALIFHRVFNAREVLIQLSRRGTFVFVLCGGTYGCWSLLHPFVPEPLGLLLSLGACGSAAVWFDQVSRGWFDSASRRKLEELRKAAIEISNHEVRTDRLVTRFQSLLQSECNAQFCTFLFDSDENYAGASLAFAKDRSGFSALRDMGWTTPESLVRRRSTPPLADLRDFVEGHSIGLLISTPKGSPAPSLIIALGRRADESPFTYPEIERIQALAALFDNLLARSRRIAHAALVARIEYLAVASRGLAHDLKNLITPVSSFLVHTDGLFPPNSPAGDVHASAKRATEVMSDYVRENLFFSEKLTPRLELFRVNDLLRQVEEAVLPMAASRTVNISVTTLHQRDLIADRILLKRMLVNLVTNAIDASIKGGIVTISSRDNGSGGLRLDVSDQGSGIPTENLSRIFDPYFTTKEFGDELRGFGLGLTIAQRIVHLHRGQISVSSRKDKGTTFSVEIPLCQPEVATSPPQSAVSLPLDLPVPTPILP